MKPSIGRIVIYHFSENQRELSNNYQKDAPAVITAVWSDTCVNLKVLTDGVHDIWVTSVTNGEGDRQWSWPVIN